VSQPAQDPQGLSRAQVEQNRRQVSAGSIQFDTRKTVRQEQAGATVEHRLTDTDTLRLAGYGGSRTVEQFLSIPLDNQLDVTSSGGVVDLDRGYYGADLRWTRAMRLAGGPFSLALGLGHDHQKERRRGFINQNGTATDLKRDENDTVWNTDLYLQTDWKFAPRWLVSAGVRRSVVHFDSSDYYVAGANPDDSGSARFTNTSPALGITFSATPSLNLYGNVGRGFETPTFAELAYRPGGGTGLNFDLQPSTSTHAELGAKAFVGASQRLTAAIFHIDTRNEIVIDSAIGGRTVFKNAGGTERRGAEASWSGKASATVAFLAVATWIDARYREGFSSGTPPVAIPAGNHLPGIPRRTAFAEVAWRPAGPAWHTALEARYSDRVYVNDANAESAPPYAILNWRLVLEQRGGRWLLSEFLRIDNIGNREYIGSVIVGDGNGRFYEPAPTRSAVIGATAQLRF
jgi:iron complex outermembrane recepter protein